MNTFGNIFRLTSFGESHGKALGGVLDGCPAGLFIDEEFIQSELNRRRPGQSNLTTDRNESDKVIFLSGIFEGKTTGAPIAFIVNNSDQKSGDYENLKNIFRPSHADYTYSKKYGVRDYRGGGRSSARETISRVVGGAIAKLLLKEYAIVFYSYTSQVGNIRVEKDYTQLNLQQSFENRIHCPDIYAAQKMETLIQTIKDEGDSIGGRATCVIKNVPVGLGEPVFGKLQVALAGAMMSINAAKGFEYGTGFNTNIRGSEVNDEFSIHNGGVALKSNHSGGIQGGISNGEDIYFNVAFKPISTIFKEQNTVDINGNNTVIKAAGRHDPCVLPRVLPVVEAMAALVIADYLLLAKAK